MKTHKFFERYLNNDLNYLFDYLQNFKDEIVNKNSLMLSDEDLLIAKKTDNVSTHFGNHYNIFDTKEECINLLKNSLRDMAIEACEYYEYNFEKNNYYIHGWFNFDYKTLSDGLNFSGVNPLKNSKHFHDHSGGKGMPWLHGYYCVNAEPSSTFYKIDREIVFENINKNNRAIVSETGHPHGRDDWFFDKPRVTIAYDITPLSALPNIPSEISIWKKL